MSSATMHVSTAEYERLINDAGHYDKDHDDMQEYAEQLRLAAALRAKRERELRKEVARARRPSS